MKPKRLLERRDHTEEGGPRRRQHLGRQPGTRMGPLVPTRASLSAGLPGYQGVQPQGAERDSKLWASRAWVLAGPFFVTSKSLKKHLPSGQKEKGPLEK